MEKSITARTTLVYVILTIVGIIFVFPFLWMLLTSLKNFDDSVAIPLRWLPRNGWKWENYFRLFTLVPFAHFYFNTIVLVFFRIVCALGFSSMAGYAFARIPFPGSKFLFALVILQFMIPGSVFTLPQYRMLLSMGMLNTMFALIFPGLINVFGIFLMRQGYLVLPASLEEASVMDGCKRWQVFAHIYFPLAKAPLITLSIFTMLGTWKDLLWPLIVNDDQRKMPISAGLVFLQGSQSTIVHNGILMAGSALTVIPLIVFYFIFQQHFHSGIQITGNK